MHTVVTVRLLTAVGIPKFDSCCIAMFCSENVIVCILVTKHPVLGNYSVSTKNVSFATYAFSPLINRSENTETIFLNL